MKTFNVPDHLEKEFRRIVTEGGLAIIDQSEWQRFIAEPKLPVMDVKVIPFTPRRKPTPPTHPRPAA